MASQRQEISHKAGETAGHAQEKSEGMMNQMSNAASGTAQQASTILQQTGESVMNMAAGAADAVKNTLGLNESNNPTSNTPSNTPSNTHNNPTATTATTAIPSTTTTHPRT